MFRSPFQRLRLHALCVFEYAAMMAGSRGLVLTLV